MVVGAAELRLPPEASHEEHLREPAHRHTQPPAGLDEVPRHIEDPVGVMVRIDVGGRGTGHPHEGVELARHLPLHAARVLHVDQPPPPVVEGHVNAQPEVGALLGEPHGGGRVRPVHQEARAGDDAAIVGLEDAEVDLVGHAQIIGVDDDQALSHLGIGDLGGRVRLVGRAGRRPRRRARGREPAARASESRSEEYPSR